MSRTKNPAACTMAQSAPAVPTLEGDGDVRALMLHCARMLLGWLKNIDAERECMSDADTWNDDDSAIDLAMCHAFDGVSKWVADLPERKAFEAQWWNLSGVVTLAARAFPNKDTAYWRMLDRADNGMQSLPEVWMAADGGLSAPSEKASLHCVRRQHEAC